MNCINQFKIEQKVDIFEIVKAMRTQRPGLVANVVSYNIFGYYKIFILSLLYQDQYEFIHQGLITMLKQYALYCNFAEGTAV